MTVFARGLLNRLFTRAYVPGDQLADDRLLSSLPADRRHTLIAAPDEHGLRFDIRLQGDDETVFLRYPGHAMTDLFWPGDHRAGDLMSATQRSWRRWSSVENAWLGALVDAGVAPATAART